MIHRIRERSAFQRLAREGTRFRTSALWCTWCPDPDLMTTHVAFAIGRASGPAVVRNRRRRQIRSVLHQLDQTTGLPTGLILIGARKPLLELTFESLSTQVTSLIRSCSAGSNT